ncbi:transglutaminase domain-containing protein [Luteolibacter luteus]|uniref:Transglutaminase-like domain-containing protein n=1 Tax=Luteolibacter luteus TaxID=2728835 RepID=A0A858RK45_9BACT|nr:transglutaminase domain-containing protein [Luteolibacter luteus]QJE96423.1 hypothetical protein HHL09_11730 [Luteolibacter luteus]
MTQGPPRYLLGLAILFWAAITERVVPGLICALLIEGANWTRVRWAFGEKAALVAWRLAVLFLVMAMVLVLLQGGSRLTAMSRVFTWLPVIMFPLQFVQSYGTSRTLPLSTFSMMVRRRRAHALAHGLPYREVRFSFGYAYLCGILLACSLGENAGAPWFYPGLILIVFWAFVSMNWKSVGLATVVVLLLCALGGIGGQRGLTALYMYATTGNSSPDSDPTLNNARERNTSIGDMGKLKQSPEVVWRLIQEKGPLPRLLRVASYNTYSGTVWQAQIPRDRNTDAKDFEALPELGNPANPDDPEDSFQICPPGLPNQSVAIDPQLNRFKIRGVVPDRGGLFPLPANAASLHQFAFEELERNSFGTFKIKPSQPVSDARVLWGDEFATEAPPWESIVSEGKAYSRMGSIRAFDTKPSGRNRGWSVIHLSDAERNLLRDGKFQGRPWPWRSMIPSGRPKWRLVQPDLSIPPKEAKVLAEIVDELGLRDGSTIERIERLREYFLSNFRYSKYNSVPRDLEGLLRQNKRLRSVLRDEDRTLIATFLQYTRAGHCEFFATSAALLLRESGIPTRYVSGFAVVERNQETGETVIRGTHAHAWCRAWDEASQQWFDVDLTPPDWTGMETPRMSRFQGFQDAMQRLREDLLVWRDQPGHMAIITSILLTPVLIGLGFLGRNLWKSRQQLEATKRKKRGPVVLAETPLLSLEKAARKVLGERPPGLPLGSWLLQLSPRISSPELLAEAVRIHHGLRFDPQPGDPQAGSRLQSLVREIKNQLTKRP